MYWNSAYWHNKTPDVDDDFIVTTHPLFIISSGNCRVSTKSASTHRPHGRSDYQLIYIASGRGNFVFHGVKTMVPAGNMILFRPGVEQNYFYKDTDKTNAYWVHFSGSHVEEILEECGITQDMTVIHTGTSLEYKNIFQEMIQELKLCKKHYEEVLANRFQYMLYLVHRAINIQQRAQNSILISELEETIRYFHMNYNKPLSIEEYAAQHHMSISWFIRSFREYTGSTPTQYLLTLRISNAKSLLQTTKHNVTEIARIVGYDNPFYFSRIFKKHTGLSPSQYREENQKQDNPAGT